MLEKKPYVTGKRKAVYGLTEKGRAFMPSLLEVANGAHSRIRTTVQVGGSIFC